MTSLPTPISATMSRRDKLAAMLAAEPDNVFLRYALALELEKAGQIDECLARYRELFTSDPPYVPAFQMAGQLLVRLERVAEATVVLEMGIEQARAQGLERAAHEMQGLLDELA